jgi:hypothetical protein
VNVLDLWILTLLPVLRCYNDLAFTVPIVAFCEIHLIQCPFSGLRTLLLTSPIDDQTYKENDFTFLTCLTVNSSFRASNGESFVAARLLNHRFRIDIYSYSRHISRFVAPLLNIVPNLAADFAEHLPSFSDLRGLFSLWSAQKVLMMLERRSPDLDLAIIPL